jgi:lysophospholipase L1-like esterase
MKIQKIVIVGNSVALRNRPHNNLTSKNYGQIIEKTLNERKQDGIIQVNNLAFTRATMYDLHKVYPQIINNFGNLYIINIGTSDAASREIPRWFADFLFSNKRNVFNKIMKGFHHYFIKPQRKLFVKLRGKRAWTSAKVFKQEYSKLIYEIQHNTNGKVICISNNLPNERIEKEVPGSYKNYQKFNTIIQSICKDKGATYINLDDLIAEKHYPDGTHFSEEGNKEIANRLLKIIDNNQYFKI